MTSKHAEHLSELISAANAINNETQAGFGGLTTQQLNWKPGADQWSVAQCFDHLLTANEAYSPIFEKILSGEKRTTFWESLPGLPAFWGKMLIKALDPESSRKLKAPKIFHPSSSSVDGAIIRRFIEQQNQVIRYMRATEDLDLEKIKISSPVTNLITYSLMDAYRIIIIHEKDISFKQPGCRRWMAFRKDRVDCERGLLRARLFVRSCCDWQHKTAGSQDRLV